MSGFPKLRVTHWIDGQPSQEILDFEQAPYFLFHYDMIVAVEGEVIHSYEDLLELASQDRHRDKDFLLVELETVIGGG